MLRTMLGLLCLLLAFSTPVAAASHGSVPTCDFQNTPQDGCGTSPGLYFAPAVSSTTKPTSAQWQAYAATSGQTWDSAHPQQFNVAAIDYGIGPNQLVSAMADVAGYNATGAPATTKCSYQAATGATASFTGQVSGTTLTTTDNTVTGTIAVGMELVTGPSGVITNTYILAKLVDNGTTTTWQLNASGTYGPEAITASDTYQLAGWTAGDPTFICSSDTNPAGNAIAITGLNFGPTSYQGSPVGTHDCVNFVVAGRGTSYTPTISVTNNAFINGSKCAPEISGSRYGMISSISGTRAPLKIWNNYVDGRANDAGNCCLPPGNTGFFVFVNMEATVDIEFNYVLRNPSAPVGVTFASGNESAFPCSNGMAYSAPSYSLIHKYNYYDQFGSTYGAGHMEIVAFEGANGVSVCSRVDDYNVVLWSSSTAAEGAASFFYWGGGGQLQYGEAKYNTIVTNLTGGKQYPELYDYYNWSTNGGTPNYIAIAGTGSSCPIPAGTYTGSGWACGNPAKGQSVAGGTGNTYNSVIGLQNNTGSGPITGSAWNGGCNSTDNAAGLCPNSGNYPALANGVVIPSGGGTVLNSFVNNRVVSETASEADHGTDTLSNVTVAASGGPFSGTTITLSANCPSTVVNSIVIDTTQANAVVGAIASCPTSGATLTLYANASVSVANGDALKLASFGYGTVAWTNNYIDGGSSGGSPNNIPQYWSANPQVVSGGYAAGGAGGCAVPITLANNVELRTGGATRYPNVNLFTSHSGGC